MWSRITHDGAVWIGQGTNHIHGSFMTGHRSYAVLGGVLVALGVVSLVGFALLAGADPHVPDRPRPSGHGSLRSRNL